jgi:hypothetical protein
MLIRTLALVLTLTATAAVAQDLRSTRDVLPHCAAGLVPNSQDVVGGRCVGIMLTLQFVSRVLPDNLKYCQPSGAPIEQMVQAVTAFVEANPESAGQDFRLVALAALRNKWPCQE